jgi:hypothetical protein
MVATALVTPITDVPSITKALAMPFAPKDVKFKPQSVKGNRALALAYVDVRVIQDRLDEVLGVENWQDGYELLPDNSVMCRLKLRIGKRWITKMDVGSPSEQPDGGDRLKAAFSDALKRAAVKFGIGRYLYRLKAEWCDYDPVKKQFAQQPKLPAFALPEPAQVKLEPKPVKSEPAKTFSPPKLPADGEELHQRLREKDAKLASEGRCQLGALLTHITQAGVNAGFGNDIRNWVGPAVELAVAETKAFTAKHPVRETKAVA